MNQITADTSIYSSEIECGDRRCWNWALGFASCTYVYSWGQRYSVRRYIYDVYRGQGHELGGPLEPGKRLVGTCGNSSCVSPYHHVPAGSKRVEPANSVDEVRTGKAI